MPERVVIVGASAAGLTTAEALRRRGYDYFWTDQYATKIQAYGTFPPDAEFQLLSGDPGARRFVAAYGQHGTVTGVLGWNASPRELRALRQLVVDRTPWTTLPAAVGTAAAS
jgi:hypothetical protein